jgi:hypothetical protein
MLEGKQIYYGLLQEIPLGGAEQIAVGVGINAREHLIVKLAGVPIPSGSDAA